MAKLFALAASIAVFLGWPALGVANTLTFGINSQRTGWDASETSLTPLNVGSLKHRWDSAPFATATVNGTTYAPHVYGAPLEVDAVPIGAGTYAGKTLPLIVVGTTNGDAYAVCAFAQPGVPAGAVVWTTHFGMPEKEHLDGGLPLGIESTGYH